MMAFGFSGYLLPWNELAFFATKVGTDIIGEVPVIGEDGKPVVLKPVEELFNLLKPSFTTRPSLEEILSGQTIKKQQGNALYISPESVDMLFYPDVRNKIKEWQQEYFDVTLSGGKRDKAKDNILRVFTSLIYIGQGRQQEKALSSRDEAKIRLEFGKIDKSCREIFRQATRSLENRKLWINKKFPDVGEQIVKEGILDSLYLPERLRNIVFAKKYKCTERAIEECLRKWQVLKYDKLLTKEKAPITIRG